MWKVCAARLRIRVHGPVACGTSQTEYSPAFTSWQHGVIERDARRRIGAGMPDAVPRHELPEQGAPARDGTAVLDGDGRVGDVLRDTAALAEGVALGTRRRGHADGRREDEEQLEHATHGALMP